MPNQNNPNQSSPVVPPVISPKADLPPLPPDFQNVAAPPSAKPESAGPPDIPPIISQTPKKKFGGGRIIATILGILLLVGGIGAGVALTFQPQLFQQLAFIPQGTTGGMLGNQPPGEQPVVTRRNNNENPPASTAPQATPYINPIVQQDCIYGAVADLQGGHCASGPNGGVTTGAGGANHDVAAGGTCNTTLDCSGTLGCWNGKCSTPPSNNPPGASCVTDVNCVNGYVCTNGTCQGNPVTATCGRNVDTGAPVCCTSGCATGNLTCEQGRQECKTGGTFCTIQASSSDCGGAHTTTTGGSPSPTAPQCLNVLAFSSTWNLLAGTDLSALTPGTSVNFCVGGSQGTFDQAQFKINTTTGPVTANKGQGAAAGDFCQIYTILSTDTSISVKAKIHDSVSNTWAGETF